MFSHIVAAFSFSQRLNRVFKVVVEKRGELGWVNECLSLSSPCGFKAHPTPRYRRFDSLSLFLISSRLSQA